MNKVPTEVRNRNRRNLIIMIVVFIMPMAIAWFVLQNIDMFKPSGSRNFGQLVHPAIPLENFELKLSDDSPLVLDTIKGKWSVIFFAGSHCDALCQETVSKIHQARLAQGKEMHRLKYYYINSSAEPLDTQSAEFIKQFTDLRTASGDRQAIEKLMTQFSASGVAPDEVGRIFLLDPLGNIMMTYDKGFVVRDLLKDLEHLLKYSQIG